jgi:hypothetical protein
MLRFKLGGCTSRHRLQLKQRGSAAARAWVGSAPALIVTKALQHWKCNRTLPRRHSSASRSRFAVGPDMSDTPSRTGFIPIYGLPMT